MEADPSLDIDMSIVEAGMSRPNRKGTLRYNPFAQHYKKEGVIQVDRVEYSLNKKKRWSMVNDFAQQVQNGNSKAEVMQRKSRRRMWAATCGPDKINQLVLSFSGQQPKEAFEHAPAPQQAVKIITTRKGPVAVKLRSKGKRVVGKHEGARAQLEAGAAKEAVAIAVHPCMEQGRYPLMDNKGRNTRAWNKGAHSRERAAKRGGGVLSVGDDE